MSDLPTSLVNKIIRQAATDRLEEFTPKKGSGTEFHPLRVDLGWE